MMPKALETGDYLIEFDPCAGRSLLSIVRKKDGKAKSIVCRKSDFTDCLRTHSLERTIQTWLKIMRNLEWEPMYKPERP